MGMSTGGNEGGPMTDINTTPLVDVMLVLLIIFMITAPVLAHRADVTLPQPSSKASKPALEVHLHLGAVGGTSQYYLDDQLTDLQGIVLALREHGRMAADEQATFILQADDQVPYTRLTELVATAHQAGVKRVVFGGL